MTSPEKENKEKGFWAGVTTAFEHLVDDVEGKLDGVMGVRASEVSVNDDEKENDKENESEKETKPITEEQPEGSNQPDKAGWKSLLGGFVGTIQEVATDLITDETPLTPSPNDCKPTDKEEEEELESEPLTPPPSYPTLLKAQSPADSVTDSAGTDKRIDNLVSEWIQLVTSVDREDPQPLADVVQEIEMELALDGAIKLETLDKMGRTTAVNLFMNPSDQGIHELFLSEIEAVESVAYATLHSPVKSSSEPQSPSYLSDQNQMDVLRRGVTSLREAVSLFYSRVLSGKVGNEEKSEGS